MKKEAIQAYQKFGKMKDKDFQDLFVRIATSEAINEVFRHDAKVRKNIEDAKQIVSMMLVAKINPQLN